MEVVRYYPYRIARIRDVQITLSIEHCKGFIDEIKNQCSSEIPRGMFPNHSCFEIIDEHYQRILIWICDFNIMFGTQIELIYPENNGIEIKRWSVKVVRYYPYRKGFVRGTGIAIPREFAKPLEDLLHQLNGSKIDNHVCFEIVDDRGENRAIMFTDHECITGEYVKDGSW